MITELNYAIAVFTVRIIAGILFFIQGYDKVFRIGMTEMKQTVKSALSHSRLPDGLLSFIVPFNSWIELICGFLLIIGFFKYYAIYFLCLNLVIVVLGFSMEKPMWENNHVFIRLILLIMLLITPVEWDRFSIDYLFALSKLTI